MVTIKTAGFIRIGKNLGELAAGNAALYDGTMTRWAEKTRDALEATLYPPKRPEQRYVRTYTLKHSFGTYRQRPGRHVVQNTATQRGRTYASFVIGTGRPKGKGQTRGHRQNNWWLMRNKIEDRIPELAEDIAKDLAKVVDK